MRMRILPLALASATAVAQALGGERGTMSRLSNGSHSIESLMLQGSILFAAAHVEEEGAGRPLSKGTGRPLSDPSNPIKDERAFNRISAPDANSCGGCHNLPYGIAGGGGDFVANVFVLGPRFDFITFDPSEKMPTRGNVDESGKPASVQTIANMRSTTGLFGAGYLEMLARQITQDLQIFRDSLMLGQTKELKSKGISYGKLTRTKAGLWDTSKVEGLSRLSLLSTDSTNPPSLVIRPWHQAGHAVSIREFTNTAFNHHHGMQSTERFGLDTDPDGDGVKNELTVGDITAVSLWQATLQVPGRVISRHPVIEQAVLNGERVFAKIGCGTCHIPKLALDNQGWIYSEPNPYNPPGNLRKGEAPDVTVDLNSDELPAPRLKPDANGIVWVDAFTDFKLHDIGGAEDVEPLDMDQSRWSPIIRVGGEPFLNNRPRRAALNGRNTSLPDRLDSGGPNLAIAGDQRQTQGERSCGDDSIGKVGNGLARNSSNCGGHGMIEFNHAERRGWVAEHVIHYGERRWNDSALLDEVGRLDNTHRWHINRSTGFRRTIEGGYRRAGKPGIVEQIPKQGMSIPDDTGHLKNSSRGKLPHISLRASSISSAEIEKPISFQRPRTDLRGEGSLGARKLAKSRTSICLSTGNSRSLAITASSIRCAGMSPYYRERDGGASA